MAFVTLHTEKLKQNFLYLDTIFHKEKIEWSVVSKLLCGNRLYLNELIKLGVRQICDSRLTNLRIIKAIDSSIQTVYIKPPAKRSVPSVVKYADISLNTEIETIKLLSEEAGKQKKKHKIIIMIELGELREGVMREDLMDFYEKVFKLKNIEVIGIGANMTCLYGVLPNHDKLIQLSLYKQLIEAKFRKKIPLVSGGSSVTIPLIFQKLLPAGINHFRVGETLFLGTNVYSDTPFEKMQPHIFMLYTEIIELIEKPMLPAGEMGTNVEGHSISMEDGLPGETSFRAIIDIGLLDVDVSHINPVDESLSIVGASSDMIVIDLGENKGNYKVGGLIAFKMDYMGTLRIINSKYIEKRLVS